MKYVLRREREQLWGIREHIPSVMKILYYEHKSPLQPTNQQTSDL